MYEILIRKVHSNYLNWSILEWKYFHEDNWNQGPGQNKFAYNIQQFSSSNLVYNIVNSSEPPDPELA